MTELARAMQIGAALPQLQREAVERLAPLLIRLPIADLHALADAIEQKGDARLAWIAQSRALRARAATVRAMRRTRLDRACAAAGLGGYHGCTLHNAKIGADTGRPWRGVDSSALRYALRLEREALRCGQNRGSLGAADDASLRTQHLSRVRSRIGARPCSTQRNPRKENR